MYVYIYTLEVKDIKKIEPRGIVDYQPLLKQ